MGYLRRELPRSIYLLTALIGLIWMEGLPPERILPPRLSSLEYGWNLEHRWNTDAAAVAKDPERKQRAGAVFSLSDCESKR